MKQNISITQVFNNDKIRHIFYAVIIACAIIDVIAALSTISSNILGLAAAAFFVAAVWFIISTIRSRVIDS